MQDTIIQFFLRNYIFVSILFSIFIGLVVELDIKIGGKPIGWLYKFWINFSGSMIGWFALYILIVFFNKTLLIGFTFAHLFLFLVAFCGLVGFLPKFLIEIIEGVASLIKLGGDKIGK